MTVKDIRSTINETLLSLGLKKGLEKQEPLKYWEKVVGKKIATHSQAVKIKNHILYVNTSSPVWAQELSLLKKQLIEKINTCQKKEVVKDIRFAGRGIENHQEPINNMSINTEKVRLDRNEIKLVNKVINNLENSEIKDKLRNILIADKKFKKQQQLNKKTKE